MCTETVPRSACSTTAIQYADWLTPGKSPASATIFPSVRNVLQGADGLKIFSWLAPLLALCFIVFVAGAFTTRFEVFPYHYLKNPLDAAEALLIREKGEKVPYAVGAKPVHPEDWAAPSVREPGAVGVRNFNTDKALSGYTVYTPVAPGYPIRLIDMQGNTVHEWRLPIEDLSGPRDDGLDLNPGEKITIAHPRVLEDGSLLLVLGVPPFYTPWGMGIVKLDKDSNLVWKYLRQAHHDLDLDAAGNIYGLTHSVVYEPWPGLERIKTPFIDDQVVKLDRNGKQLASTSVLAAIQNSPYQSILQYARTEWPKGDLLHVNSITYLDEKAAASFPGADAGDVLLSLRQISVIAIMDIEAATIKWALRGPWHAQHDPDVLDNGNMLIFDNRGDIQNGGATRIIEFNPRTMEILWEYPGDNDDRLYSSIYGSQQRLANGNTLISEGNNGRLLEVTRGGEIVWEYHIPERKTNRKGIEVASVVFGHRFTPEELPFLRQ
jgi:outer membrane protein assembly factor BamB